MTSRAEKVGGGVDREGGTMPEPTRFRARERMTARWVRWAGWVHGSKAPGAGGGRGEEGMSTAELLGNAAIAIGALVVLWGALRSAGINIIGWIEETVTGQ